MQENYHLLNRNNSTKKKWLTDSLNSLCRNLRTLFDVSQSYTKNYQLITPLYMKTRTQHNKPCLQKEKILKKYSLTLLTSFYLIVHFLITRSTLHGTTVKRRLRIIIVRSNVKNSNFVLPKFTMYIKWQCCSTQCNANTETKGILSSQYVVPFSFLIPTFSCVFFLIQLVTTSFRSMLVHSPVFFSTSIKSIFPFCQYLRA